MTAAVLIVDDSLTVRMDLAQAFTDAGWRVEACATAAEARAAVAAGRFEVVVLDVVLPDGDGIELLRELRGPGAPRELVVLMLSSEAEVADRIRGLRTGADDYVGKPYDAAHVIARARALTRARSAGAAAPDVVVIDDSPTFRGELTTALEAAGYRVASAATGEDGLAAIADLRPAAVIVDGMLPGIDGITVIRRIRIDAALRGTVCLLLTGADDRQLELRALDAGADAFVRKTDDLELVLARLAAARRRASAPAEEVATLHGPKKVLLIAPAPEPALTAVLRADGHAVVPARPGDAILELLAVEAMDCILLELTPGSDALAVCARIKAAPVVRDIPLIVVAVRDDRGAMLDSLAAGADDYVAGGGDLDVLRARVHAQLRRKQLEDESRRIRLRLLQHELEAAEERAARRLAEARAALVDELERRNEELDAFSYTVSHDLRSPLNAIAGFADALARDHAAALPARAAECVARIQAAATRMDDLIDALLELARLSRVEPRRGPVDVSLLAHQVCAELRARDPDRVVELAITDGVTASADGRLLRIVLENLLGNAWKFTSRTEAARIAVGASADDGGPVYWVRDNGVGFDMARAARLFAPFQRLHGGDQFRGTGIGLATVRRIIERHGGRVWAEAAVGAGTTISFTLSPGGTSSLPRRGEEVS
ncbi:MAG TPA: response regulator [Kofleriaceae bacterium]|jgi:DNA-binding response OmpR family regulator|nr:response regulator [Kofleriaceae bacterium]